MANFYTVTSASEAASRGLSGRSLATAVTIEGEIGIEPLSYTTIHGLIRLVNSRRENRRSVRTRRDEDIFQNLLKYGFIEKANTPNPY